MAQAEQIKQKMSNILAINASIEAAGPISKEQD